MQPPAPNDCGDGGLRLPSGVDAKRHVRLSEPLDRCVLACPAALRNRCRPALRFLSHTLGCSVQPKHQESMPNGLCASLSFSTALKSHAAYTLREPTSGYL